MESILSKIVDRKKIEVREKKRVASAISLERSTKFSDETRGFAASLRENSRRKPAIIAEIKRGSPSLGCIRPEMDVKFQAAAYDRGGASALSVLTDSDFFYADEHDFPEVHNSTTLPILRKEFIIDEYQVVESKAMGADCILLIMTILKDHCAQTLSQLAHELSMDVLVEVHSSTELQRVLDNIDFDLIGVNNRNLSTFETSLNTVLELANLVGDQTYLVAESGLSSAVDISNLYERGINKFLVGEAFIRSSNPEETVRSFVERNQA